MPVWNIPSIPLFGDGEAAPAEMVVANQARIATLAASFGWRRAGIGETIYKVSVGGGRRSPFQATARSMILVPQEWRDRSAVLLSHDPGKGIQHINGHVKAFPVKVSDVSPVRSGVLHLPVFPPLLRLSHKTPRSIVRMRCNNRRVVSPPV